MVNGLKTQSILDAIDEEYVMARAAHHPMASRHEGYAVLLEEVDELWDLVKQRYPSKVEMRKEAIQVAAMALAFICEVCE